MAFTTWTDLLQRLKNDLAGASWSTKSYTVDGVTREFRGFSEFMAFFREVEHRARLESESTAIPRGRTYARSRS